MEGEPADHPRRKRKHVRMTCHEGPTSAWRCGGTPPCLVQLTAACGGHHSNKADRVVRNAAVGVASKGVLSNAFLRGTRKGKELLEHWSIHYFPFCCDGASRPQARPTPSPPRVARRTRTCTRDGGDFLRERPCQLTLIPICQPARLSPNTDPWGATARLRRPGYLPTRRLRQRASSRAGPATTRRGPHGGCARAGTLLPKTLRCRASSEAPCPPTPHEVLSPQPAL